MEDLQRYDADEIAELVAPSYDVEHVASSIFGLWNARDDSRWRQNREENGFGWQVVGNDDFPPEAEFLRPLKNLLLDVGGRGFCNPWMDEPHIDPLLSRGMFWKGDEAYFNYGAPNRCHSNASCAWMQNRERVVIATGYALSDDGLWRQHSWYFDLFGSDSGGVALVETTSPRIAYFGFVLTYRESELFAYENE